MRGRYDYPPDLVAAFDSFLASGHLPTSLIASLLTPKLLQRGRLPTLYVTLVIALMSVSIQMIDSMWAILLGKTFIGFSLGILETAAGRMI